MSDINFIEIAKTKVEAIREQARHEHECPGYGNDLSASAMEHGFYRWILNEVACGDPRNAGELARIALTTGQISFRRCQ